jgi:hypothetical protein
MKTVAMRRSLAALCIGAFALVGAGCLPGGVTFQPGGGGGGACPAGTWVLTSQTITNSLQTLLGNATVTGSGSGVTLTLTPGSPNTWSLTADQMLHITASNVDVQASVNASASGTYTTSGNNITFTLQNLSGTIAASGTVFGHSFSINWPLSQSGDIQKLYGLSGTASYACNADGTLTLSLPSQQMHFKQH